MPVERQAAHLIMNSILNDEVCEIVHGLTEAQVYATEGVEILIRAMDEHFLSNTESRLFNLWRAMRKHEKTEIMTWVQYIKQTKKVFRDLEKFGLNLGNKVVAIDMIEATELEACTILHIESIARNMHETHDLSIKNVEESIRRLRLDDNEQKVMEVAEVKATTEEQKVQENNEEAPWVKSKRFQRGGRYRRYQPGNRGSNQTSNLLTSLVQAQI